MFVDDAYFRPTYALGKNDSSGGEQSDEEPEKPLNDAWRRET